MIIFFSLIGQWLNVIDGGLKFMPLEQKRVFSRFINPAKYAGKHYAKIELKEFEDPDKTSD